MRCTEVSKNVEPFKSACILWAGPAEIAARDTAGVLHIYIISKFNCGTCKHAVKDDTFQAGDYSRLSMKKITHREVNNGRASKRKS